MEAAFFDLDKTVIAKASMVAFGRSFYREGLINRRLMARALYGQLVYLHLGADEDRLARMRDSVLALTRGWSRARVEDIVVDTLEAVVEPIVYDEALGLIHEHHEAGRAVYIVSASPQEIVAPLARYLEVDGYLATVSAVDDDGRYTGTTEFYCYGPNKATAMERLARERDIDLAGSWAYSDSVTDVPMLEVVGHAVAVNPDRDLARVAQERGWEVRTFSRQRPLRTRVPLPPPGPTAAVGGTVAAVAGGAAAWWWLRRHREPVMPVEPAALARAIEEIRRRGPSSRPRRRGQRRRGAAAASSWRRILGPSSAARSADGFLRSVRSLVQSP